MQDSVTRHGTVSKNVAEAPMQSRRRTIDMPISPSKLTYPPHAQVAVDEWGFIRKVGRISSRERRQATSVMRLQPEDHGELRQLQIFLMDSSPALRK